MRGLVFPFVHDCPVTSLARTTLEIAIVTQVVRAGLQNESSWFQAES